MNGSDGSSLPSVSNAEWLERNFPCKQACPVHTEAGKYVTLIAQGKYREAYAVARRPNPLASICGRICAAPCESVCRRGEIDAPIAIRALKRFVTERFGVESMMDFSVLTEIYGERRGRYAERVAVIGSGPAGLACAHDLALMGYPVTIFEASPVAGGMLRLGVPEYRLPRALIQLEVNAILSLGVELKTNTRLGRDFTLDDLRGQGFSAIFLGVGAMRSRELTIPGTDLDGVLRGVDYLLNVNLGYKVEMGQRIVVIGGGNVALDVARTAARSGEQINLQRNLSIVQALDVARSAIRFGAREVTVCSLESESEMPAAKEEIEEAEREGIRFLHRVGPKRLVGEKGTVIGVEFLRVSRVFDENGRFSPRFVDGSETIFPTDTVIISIGQTGDFSFLRPEDRIEAHAGRIVIDPETLATTAPGVWAGGDAAFGPRIAINAIADGKKGARSIDEHFRGAVRADREVEIEIDVHSRYERELDYEGIPRQKPPTRPIARRIGIAEVEECFGEREARREGTRCLHCWTNTIFAQDPKAGTECILCGGCQDICPENCIEILPSALVRELPAAALELAPLLTADGFRAGSIFIKDEEVCIRCGLCAMRCPVGTITMQSFHRREDSVA
jgi:NADPH-dependent glutamate synthase beta subunit-like oxidoreductase/NAD-dependent dihydropyrimidine dehydrogenase PreA subunit